MKPQLTLTSMITWPIKNSKLFKIKKLMTVLSATIVGLCLSLPASAQVYVNGIRFQGRDLYALQQILGTRIAPGNYFLNLETGRLYPVNAPVRPPRPTYPGPSPHPICDTSPSAIGRGTAACYKPGDVIQPGDLLF
jgi:hypothetical protein